MSLLVIKESLFKLSLESKWLLYYNTFKYVRIPQSGERIKITEIGNFIIVELNVEDTLEYDIHTKTLIFDKKSGKILKIRGKINHNYVQKFCDEGNKMIEIITENQQYSWDGYFGEIYTKTRINLPEYYEVLRMKGKPIKFNDTKVIHLG